MRFSARRRALVCILASLAIAVGACRTAPIMNVETDIAPPSGTSLAEIENAIRVAGAELGWVIRPAGPGKMKGTYTHRNTASPGFDLVAVVAIHYDEQHLSIQYEGSQNLQHEGDEIHRKYNTWVANLEAQIKKAVALL
jgi:uncharacterized protein YvpB